MTALLLSTDRVSSVIQASSRTSPTYRKTVSSISGNHHQHQLHSVAKKFSPNSRLPSSSSEETRTFLTCSRENLSISHSGEIERGIGESHYKRRSLLRSTRLISIAALVVAASCFVLELWKTRQVFVNADGIEELRRDVAVLKHRLREQDLLDELKAFEEQLYSGGPGSDNDFDDDEDDDGDREPSGDYDSNYDQNNPDYSADYQVISRRIPSRSTESPKKIGNSRPGPSEFVRNDSTTTRASNR